MKGAQSISTRRAYGVQRLRATARDEGARITAPRAGRCRPGRGAGRPHPPGARSLTVSWRGGPESLGDAAGRGDPHLAGAGATVHAGARPPGPAPRGPRTRPEGPRWNDHHGGPRRDVGDGPDDHGDGRRGGGLRLRGRRSLYDRVHRPPCGNLFEALEPIRQGVRERFGAIGEGVGVERCENSSRTPGLTVLALAGSSDIGGCGRRRSHLPGKSREIQVQNSVSLPFRRLKRRYSRGVGRRMARRSRVAAD